MMFLLTCDKKLTKSQLSSTHASTKRKITDELKHNAGWYEVREGSPVEVQTTSYLKQWHHKQQQHIHRKGPVFSAGSVNSLQSLITYTK